jgi:predicted transcriptional regulator
MGWQARTKGAIIVPMSNAARQLDIDDDLETELFRAAVEKSRAAERRGEVVPHEVVREWLLALARGKQPPALQP